MKNWINKINIAFINDKSDHKILIPAIIRYFDLTREVFDNSVPEDKIEAHKKLIQDQWIIAEENVRKLEKILL